MFSTWDIVRPRYWHPMAAFEQSMMDFDQIAEHMMSSRFPFDENMRMLSQPNHQDDDDFFSDLPVRARHESPETRHEPSNRDGHRAYSSYSYTNSSIVDDQGQRITSTRRRYEDSTGRLKAVHERQIGDKKLRSVWSRRDKQDQGKHEAICSDGTPDEFEEAWKSTTFGRGEQKRRAEAIKEKGEGTSKDNGKAVADKPTSTPEAAAH